MIDSAAVTLALASGMVAAVNPCGFAMLPAYVSFFLSAEGDTEPSRAESVLRAIPVALAVSAGFMAVFGTIGIALRPFSSTLLDVAPWATVVIGIALVGLGIALLAGKELTAAVPKLNKGGKERSLRSMFLYGVSYAVASLSCTLPLFLGSIIGSFSRIGFLNGVSVLAAYGAGMGLVITALTIAIALARSSVVGLLRSGMQYVNRASGVLMVVMGAYVTWYGYWSVRIRNGDQVDAGPVVLVEEWSGDITNWVNDIGAGRLGLYALAVILGSAAIAVAGSALRRDRSAHAGPSPDGPGDASGGPATDAESADSRTEVVS